MALVAVHAQFKGDGSELLDRLVDACNPAPGAVATRPLPVRELVGFDWANWELPAPTPSAPRAANGKSPKAAKSAPSRASPARASPPKRAGSPAATPAATPGPEVGCPGFFSSPKPEVLPMPTSLLARATKA